MQSHSVLASTASSTAPRCNGGNPTAGRSWRGCVVLDLPQGVNAIEALRQFRADTGWRGLVVLAPLNAA